MINFKHIILTFILFFGAVCAAAQDKAAVLSGKVIDSDEGYPLVGVAVIVQNTKYGVVTDLDGAYELKFPDKSCEILFSCIGYDDVVMYYNGKNKSAFTKIVMKVNATQLEDVVVTGVYERKKESFTGASATFKADQIKSVGSSNVLQSLKTLDPSYKMMESTQFGSNPFAQDFVVGYFAFSDVMEPFLYAPYLVGNHPFVSRLLPSAFNENPGNGVISRADIIYTFDDDGYVSEAKWRSGSYHMEFAYVEP